MQQKAIIIVSHEEQLSTPVKYRIYRNKEGKAPEPWQCNKYWICWQWKRGKKRL